MTTTERLAYFLGHGVQDTEFLAAVVGCDAAQYRAAFARATTKARVDHLADTAMRLDAATRALDGAEWKRLPLEQQITRAAFLFQTFGA